MLLQIKVNKLRRKKHIPTDTHLGKTRSSISPSQEEVVWPWPSFFHRQVNYRWHFWNSMECHRDYPAAGGVWILRFSILPIFGMRTNMEEEVSNRPTYVLIHPCNESKLSVRISVKILHAPKKATKKNL